MKYVQKVFKGLKGVKKITSDVFDGWNYIYYMTHVSYAPIQNKAKQLIQDK